MTAPLSRWRSLSRGQQIGVVAGLVLLGGLFVVKPLWGVLAAVVAPALLKARADQAKRGARQADADASEAEGALEDAIDASLHREAEAAERDSASREALTAAQAEGEASAAERFRRELGES